jgi:hypothetical protein
VVATYAGDLYVQKPVNQEFSDFGLGSVLWQNIPYVLRSNVEARQAAVSSAIASANDVPAEYTGDVSALIDSIGAGVWLSVDIPWTKVPANFDLLVVPSSNVNSFIADGSAWAGMAGVFLKWFRPGQIVGDSLLAKSYESVVQTLATTFGAEETVINSMYETLEDWIGDYYASDSNSLLVGLDWLRQRRVPQVRWSSTSTDPVVIRTRKMIEMYASMLPVSWPSGYSCTYDTGSSSFKVNGPNGVTGDLQLPAGISGSSFKYLVENQAVMQEAYEVFSDYLSVQELVYSALTGTLQHVGVSYAVSPVDRYSLLISPYIVPSTRTMIAPWEV